MSPTPSTRTIAALVALLTFVLLLMMPRFNQQDRFVASITGTDATTFGDADEYIKVADYFAGTPSSELVLRAPFSDRPLVPAIASVLPGDHMNGLNLVNAAAVLIACLATFLTARRLGLDDTHALLAVGLLGVSFPVFYYGTIGFVDPVVVGVLALGLLATASRRWWLVLIAVVVGVLAKESAGAVAIVAGAYMFGGRRRPERNDLLWLAAIVVAGALAFVASRSLVPHDVSASWTPKWQRAKNNLTRSRGIGGVILSLGLPGLIVAGAWVKGVRWASVSRPALTALVVGAMLGVLQVIVAVPTAFLDGRHVWSALPYLVVLAAAAVDEPGLLRTRTPSGGPSTESRPFETANSGPGPDRP